MTGCERLSDRMADVACGESAWTEPELGHLRTCPDCSREWRLVEAAGRLGSGQAVDPARVAARVVERLSAEREAPRRLAVRRVGWVVGLGAAAALGILVARTVTDGRAPAPARPLVEATLLSELDGLTAAELELVLDAVDPVVSEASLAPDSVRLGDLTPSELERILRSLEGEG